MPNLRTHTEGRCCCAPVRFLRASTKSWKDIIVGPLPLLLMGVLLVLEWTLAGFPWLDVQATCSARLQCKAWTCFHARYSRVAAQPSKCQGNPIHHPQSRHAAVFAGLPFTA